MPENRELARVRFDRPSLDVLNDSLTLRQLPSNVAAEQALLGAVLSNNKAFGRVAEFLHPHHFADVLHGRIYAECARRILAAQVADPVTLGHWYRADPGAEEAGPGYLADLLTAMVGIINAGDYGRAIRACWVRREAIQAARDLLEQAYSPDGDIEESLGRLNHSIDTAISSERAEVMMFDGAIAKALKNVDEAVRTNGSVGLNIGPEFSRVRRLVRFIGGKLILVGGDTGMGKSALVWKWAVNAAISIRDRMDTGTMLQDVGGILGISLEMDSASIALRAACSFSGVPYDDAEAGRITPIQRDLLEEARVALKRLPIVFVAVGGMTPGMVRMRARQAQRRFGGKLAGIIIDHLQLMDAEADAARGGGAWAMKSIINTMIDFPKQFDCPVIGLSQVKADEIAKRQNKRPHEGDYAWGKALGQAADYALFVYREEYYLRRERPYPQLGEAPHLYQERLDNWQAAIDRVAGKAELIGAKLRGGMPLNVPLLFNGPTMTFEEEPVG